jgi:hypothetical protein
MTPRFAPLRGTPPAEPEDIPLPGPSCWGPRPDEPLPRVRAGQCQADTGDCWRHLAARTEALREAGVDARPMLLARDPGPVTLEDSDPFDPPMGAVFVIGVALGAVLGYALRVAL